MWIPIGIYKKSVLWVGSGSQRSSISTSPVSWAGWLGPHFQGGTLEIHLGRFSNMWERSEVLILCFSPWYWAGLLESKKIELDHLSIPFGIVCMDWWQLSRVTFLSCHQEINPAHSACKACGAMILSTPMGLESSLPLGVAVQWPSGVQLEDLGLHRPRLLFQGNNPWSTSPQII